MRLFQKTMEQLPLSLAFIGLPLLIFSYAPLLQLGVVSGVHIDSSFIYIVMAAVAITSLPVIMQNRRRLLSSWLLRLLIVFSGYVSLSILWSPNTFRGVIVALFYWIITVLVAAYMSYADRLSSRKPQVIKLLSVVTAVMLVFGFIQIYGEALGVPRTLLLIPQMYTSETFGVARPLAFALEPQFFASLLLIPYMWLLRQSLISSSWKYRAGFIAVAVMLILTLSRGGMLAAAIGSVIVLATTFAPIKRYAALAGCGLLSVVIALLVVFSAASLQQRDTVSGAEATRGVMSHLSFGHISLKTDNKDEVDSVSNSNRASEPSYVNSSTDSRLSMSTQAVDIWNSSPSTLLFGVGIGGFGAALNERDSSYSIGSVVNNNYLELLVETGIIGLGLFVLTLIIALLKLVRRRQWLAVAIASAFCIQWLFFSGSANVLHIWIFLAIATGIGHAYSVRTKQKSGTIHPDAT